MIYTTGTVSTVSGSAIVSGTGTKWTVNNPAIRSGTIILIKNGNANFIYMVDRVNSDTELVISQPATFTVKNTSYSINLTEPNSYSDANNRMTAIASDTTYFLRAMDQWMMNNGVVTVELSNGQKVTLDSIKKIQGDIANKADAKVIEQMQGDIGKKFDKSGGHITGDVRVTDGKSLRVNAPNNNGDTFIMTREDLSTWIGNAYADITIREDGLYSSGNKVATENTLSNGAYRGISDNIVFSGQNKYSQLSMQTYADFRKVISYDMAESYPEGVSGGIATGKQIQKPEFDFACLLNIRGWYDKSGASSCGQIYITPTGNIGFRYNKYNSDDREYYLSPVDIYCTNNTTIDNNGFIKKASPIIDINPDGTFTTNDESEGATVTRVAQGEYLIEGVLGFNSDAGWGGVDGGIEIPLDVNKQPLIWVDSKVMEDGSILVRTYHRTHPNAPKFARNDIDGYKDGDPIDIPDGRFISVRVQMPEQSIYNVRMREMEEAQKAEEERRQKEEEMKSQFGLGENDVLL
ncbi:hypothetical protein ACUU1F_000304 [Proteus mirabilis]